MRELYTEVVWCILLLSAAMQTRATPVKHIAKMMRHARTGVDMKVVADDCVATCPPCPAKDVALFEANGVDVKNADTYGIWVNSTTCNRNYLVGDTKMTWIDANDQCCKLGMKLVSFSTQQEYDCFNTLVSDVHNCGGYWTSGTDSGCVESSKKHVFSWCGTGTHFPNPTLWWKTGEPNFLYNKEKCVLTKTGHSSFMVDRHCIETNYYVCEN